MISSLEPRTSPPIEPRAIWCDFGGVLTPPVSETIAAFCGAVGAPPAVLVAAMTAIARRYGTDDLMEPLDTPLTTEQNWALEMMSEVRATSGLSIDLSNFGERWFADRDPNTELVEYLRELRSRGLFVGMLSNMVPSWDALWRKMVPPTGTFDDVVMSFEVGVRKPQREIYDLAAARAMARPVNCLLIDDLPPNCIGARAAGWRAVHFRTNRETIQEIEAWLSADEAHAREDNDATKAPSAAR